MTDEMHDHLTRLERAGFVDADVVATRDFGAEYGKDVERTCGVPTPERVTLMSAFVRATKPAA